MKKRLAIITSHPIQYNAPLFKLLAEKGRIEIKVFYTWGEAVLQNKFDPGFGKTISWDIPLLEGYDHVFVKNIATSPGSHHFRGIDNPSLVKEVKDWKADAVLLYGWAFKSHLKLMRYFKGRLPVFFRGDSTLQGQRNKLKTIARTFFLKWVYRHVDKALYVGTQNKNYYLCHGLKARQLLFAPHAIDNQRFGSNDGILSENAMEKRKALSIPVDATVFLFAGKLEPVKNPALIIAAAKELEKEPVHFIIAGNGLLEDDLKKNAGTNVSFIDFQNQQQMPELYRMGDVFMLVSVSETWGLSINEAMASGRTVLVSDACGAAEDLVEDAVNGYRFKSNDLDDLVKKIKLLSGRETDLKKMGSESFRKIQDWSYNKTAAAIEAACLSREPNV